MTLLLIAGIPVIMFLAATWLWVYVANGKLDLVGSLGTHNNGRLVDPPRQLDAATLLDASGQPLRYADLDPHWTMLVPVGGASCGRACEQVLYLTRQIRTAMGQDSKQLRRLYVGTRPVAQMPLGIESLSDGRPAPPNVGALLQTGHRGMRALTVSGADFGRLFAEYEQNPATWYLVDQRGWIMMSYNADVPYKGVIADLKFLLKN